MLRLEAERFGTAEYYEATRDGERPRVRRRAGVVRPGLRHRRRAAVHPPAAADASCTSARATGSARSSAAWPTARSASARPSAFATFRYHRIRFPDTWSYPGALLNSTATAFIDEVTFRGAIFGLLLTTGLDATVANIIQTLLYTLTTRLGAPGRDRYLLVLTIGIGFVGGWLTAATGGIAAAFLGHAITRFAVFLCTGHTGQTKPRGREEEEIETPPSPA